MTLTSRLILATSVFVLVLASSGQADNKKQVPVQDDSGAEKVNVDAIKEKYWARGDESEMGVVQNRTYSKEHRWELGVFGGFILTDPFLNVNNAGFSLGYHFSEYFAVNALFWKSFASNSTALTTFEQSREGTTNYNKPQGYYGAEAVGSLLYGKLSVLGKSIIYYDMHLLGGLGITRTESGNYITPSIGIGQQIYLNKSVSLRLDYRLMYYREEIRERVIPANMNNVIDSRNNFSNVIVFGVDFLFGGGSK